MSLAQLISTPCTLILGSQVEDGDDFSDEAPEEPDEVEAVCHIEQARRDEPDDQGELSVTLWTLFFLPDEEDLETADSVIVPGFGTFELKGDPWPALNPRTNRVEHVEATAVRTGGADEGGEGS